MPKLRFQSLVLFGQNILNIYQSSSILSTFHNVVLSSSPAVAILVPSGDHRQTRIPDPEFTKEDFAWQPSYEKLSNKRASLTVSLIYNLQSYMKRTKEKLYFVIFQNVSYCHFNVDNFYLNICGITSVFQITTVPSKEQEASIRPQGLNSTWFMLYLWPSNGL